MTRQYLDDDLDASAVEHSDSELITAVRSGDESAYATLWSRHANAALRLARQISNPSNADDLVSEAFLRVLRALQSGSGPDGAFRPYLFSTLRRINIDNGRSYYTRIALTDDERDLDLDHSDSAADVHATNAESGAAWRAWNSLPDTTKTLLWHLIIEEETPAQIAPLIGTTPNGVSSRAVRAKERLRQAFLQQHLLDADTESCRQARRRFGEYVRDALSARDRAEVSAHLETCDGCRAALFEVSDINQTMKLIIGPAVLGGLTVAGYLSAGTAAAKLSVFSQLTHIGHLLKNTAVAAGTAVATVAVAGVAVASTYVLNSDNTSRPSAGAVAPLAVTSSSTSAQLPVSVAPTVSSSPTSTTPTPTPTPTSTTPTAAKPTPTKAQTTARKVALPVVPSVSVPVPSSSTSTSSAAPPPTFVDVFVPFGFVNAANGVVASITLSTSSGWTIVGGTGPSGLLCATLTGTRITCSWPLVIPAGTDEEFNVKLEATAPAPTNGTLTWSYVDATTLTENPNQPPGNVVLPIPTG